MRTVFAALLATLIAGFTLSFAATGASAHYRHPGCCGGPLPPAYHYKTVYTHKSYTRYRDRSVYRHVSRAHRNVYVTRVQPVIDVHVVTRVHHHTIVHTRQTYSHVTQYLQPIRHVYGSTKNYYDCHCGHPRHCR